MKFPTFEPLLAAWSDLGNRFSGRHAEIHWGDIATLVGVIVGGLGFVAALYVMQRRQQQRAISNEPVHLFQDLCQAHDLSWKERRLLTRLAQSLDLKLAAELFVSPYLFDPEQLPSELASHEMTFQRIADKLFAGFEEPLPLPALASELEENLEPASPVLSYLSALPGTNEGSKAELI